MKHYKKYPNRRLYDIDASCYVTLEDLRGAIAAGERVTVTDSKTGKDLTRNVLLQVISEQEAEGHHAVLTNRVLEHIIRFYGDSMNNVVGRYIEQSILSFIEQQDLYRERMKEFTSAADPAAIFRQALDRNIEFWTRMANLNPQHTGKRGDDDAT